MLPFPFFEPLINVNKHVWSLRSERKAVKILDDLKIELVKQAQSGKREAMERLFLGESEYLYKMAFLYMKNKEDSLDLVQECILRCIASLKRLKHPRYFRTWMTRILINCAHEEWERRGKYDLAEDTVFAAGESFPKEETLDLYRAIDHLNYPYRDIIIQYYFAGNKLSEIAQSLDIPVGTVKVYHSRAKRKLKCCSLQVLLTC